MLIKKKAMDEAQTVIGCDMIIEAARITGSGQLRVDGKVVGDIEQDGDLIIGETGYVCGNVWVKDIFVAGGVKGDVHCEGKTHLSSTAKVYGGLESSYIVMDKGVIFEGACRTLRAEAIRMCGVENDGYDENDSDSGSDNDNENSSSNDNEEESLAYYVEARNA